jgi:hypothetical protein
MITSDMVGRAVLYENAVGKYGVGESVTRTQRPVEVWPFDSRLAVVRWETSQGVRRGMRRNRSTRMRCRGLF